jgi:hypothetical protein
MAQAAKAGRLLLRAAIWRIASSTAKIGEGNPPKGSKSA